MSAFAVDGPREWGRVYAGGVGSRSAANVLTVTSSATTVVPVMTLAPAARLTGTLRPPDTGVTMLPGGSVEVYRMIEGTEDFEFYDSFEAENTRGLYTSHYLPAGSYKVRGVSAYSQLAPTWWTGGRGSYAYASAERIDLSNGSEVEIDMIVLGPSAAIERIAGPNRWETSVALSQRLFPASGPQGQPAKTVPVVYVVSGEDFPDALSAGPAAHRLGGGMLLSPRDAVPAVVASEIRRLRPERIVVVGGEPSLSTAVFSELATIAPTERIAGANRYETSRRVVRDAFIARSGGAATVFVATGSKFPDALAAGPAASKVAAPVVLVPGTSAAADAATTALITELHVRDAYVVGGADSVSDGIAGSLRMALSGELTRVAGANRYVTAASLNAKFFTSSESIYLASGTSFADALAAGALVSAEAAPLYLMQQNCAPYVIETEHQRLDAWRLVLVGGPDRIAPWDISGPYC
ncbi:putative cell wall-binding protein [Leifsonia sp. AK011]|uniref:cell wall-binding repeat-containing protein n=1 Tax=Leifsonia sp. AK011 TaxID=2723075 RepID=UPI0015CA34E9|nr:cell wall-binding repeat-containing protein [Leifsonia sp. AK011]NYF08943.1 putative cell wall-binding protein [Leifsonia sp. AK011]